MTGEELEAAYGGLEPATGVPVAIHAELRGIGNVVEATAAEVASIRELLELVVAAMGLEVVAEWSRPGEEATR